MSRWPEEIYNTPSISLEFKVVVQEDRTSAGDESQQKMIACGLRDVLKAAGYTGFAVIAPCGFKAGVRIPE